GDARLAGADRRLGTRRAAGQLVPRRRHPRRSGGGGDLGFSQAAGLTKPPSRPSPRLRGGSWRRPRNPSPVRGGGWLAPRAELGAGGATDGGKRMYKATADKILPTSIIGSLPRPAWHTAQLGRRSFLEAMVNARWREQYEDAVSTHLRAQEVAG